MEIAIISDTHMPRGRRRLPDACIARLKAADLIIHAGDLSAMSVLDELGQYGDVMAVHGNVDDAAVLDLHLYDLRLVLGAARDRERLGKPERDGAGRQQHEGYTSWPPAPVAQGIERSPPERKAAGSIPAGRINPSESGFGSAEAMTTRTGWVLSSRRLWAAPAHVGRGDG